MTTSNPLEVDVDPECVRGMHQAAELLASLGHEVEEAAPLMPGKDGLRLFISVFGPAVALGISYGELLAGRPPTDDEIEPLSRAILDQAQETSSIGYLGAVAQLQALARAIVAFFAEYDLLLTPALAERPLAIGDCTGVGEQPMHDLARSGAFTPFTSLFNVTGQPAITVPVGFGEDNLPTSVQIVGKPLGEDTLLQVAAQIETARPVGAPAPARAGLGVLDAEHLGHPAGPYAKRLQARGAAAGEHRHREHQRLVPRGERRRAGQQLAGLQDGAQGRERHGEHAPAAARGVQDELDDLPVREDLGAGQLVAGMTLRAARRAPRGRRRRRPRPRRAGCGRRRARSAGRRAAARAAPSAPGGGRPARRRARWRAWWWGSPPRRPPPRRAPSRGARARGGAAWRRAASSTAGGATPRALGGAQQPPRGEPVELLDRRPGLVALGAREVDHGAHAAQGVAERGGVGEVARGELDVHPFGAEPPRVAHEAADRLAPADEAPQHRRAEQSGRSCEQDHAGEP